MKNLDRIGNAEAEIMKILWDKKGQQITSAEIRKELEEKLGWTKSTILTLIRRLVEKGIITCEKKEVFYYTPLVSEEEYLRFQTSNFIEKIYGGNVKKLISSLCRADNLTREDIEELQAYLDREADKND
jgi:BlaI family penicillinase repressor